MPSPLKGLTRAQIQVRAAQRRAALEAARAKAKADKAGKKKTPVKKTTTPKAKKQKQIPHTTGRGTPKKAKQIKRKRVT